MEGSAKKQKMYSHWAKIQKSLYVVVTVLFVAVCSVVFWNASHRPEIVFPTEVPEIGHSTEETNTGNPNTGNETADSGNENFLFEGNADNGGNALTVWVETCGADLQTLVVPSEMNGIPVTRLEKRTDASLCNIKTVVLPDSLIAIGDYVFQGCTGLTSIRIPSGVAAIGAGAFEGCTGLTAVVIGGGQEHAPNSLISIGESAFKGCCSVRNFTLPDSVKTIGAGAFSGCSSLETVTLPFVGGSANATEASASTLFGYIFGEDSYDGGTSIQQFYSATASATYCLPTPLKSVTVLGGQLFAGAFDACSGLTSVTLGDGVTRLGDRALRGCTGLTSVTFGSGVTAIDTSAFRDCKGLTSIAIPDSVKTIGAGAFSGCSSLETLTLPFVGGSADATEASASTLFGYIFGEDLYEGGKSIKQFYSTSTDSCATYSLPASLEKVTILGGQLFYGAFYACSGLTSVTLGDGVTSIGIDAFGGGTGLTSVTIGSGVTAISAGALNGCTELSTITVGNGNSRYYSMGNCIIEIESKTLIAGCKSSKIPTDSRITSIGPEAFSGCTELISVTIPDGVEIIGTEAFSGCTGLTSITISDSVTSIGYSAFRNCTKLRSIKIPSNVTSIGIAAFFGCTGLTVITIPSSVKSIGFSAFRGCTGLTKVTFENQNPWFVTPLFPTIDKPPIVLKDMTDKEQNATNLTDTYSGYQWDTGE